MDAIKFEIETPLEYVEIHTFADWHIGDRACDISAIREMIVTIKDNPNAYVICNGDLMNNATKTSVSDCYAEDIPPMEQLSTMCGLLEPIKDKIIMLCQGNHEARTYRNDGIDLTYLVAKQLGIADRYCRNGGVVFLRFDNGVTGKSDRHGNKLCYILYATHGSGGGRKEGAKAIRLADMASIVDADIYVHSHTHLPMIIKESYYRTSAANSSVAKVDKLFVNTSAQLDYGGYGQSYEFKPASKNNVTILLSGKRKEYTAKL